VSLKSRTASELRNSTTEVKVKSKAADKVTKGAVVVVSADNATVNDIVTEPATAVVKPVVKKPPKKRAAKIVLEEGQLAISKQLKLKLPTRPLPLSALTPEMGLLPAPPPPQNAYDLTDQVIVRLS
jgi:hypothetical protein